ncbi:MAG: hypothetical protein AAFP69_00645, partial [Planctomycetota bacterium]
EKLQRFRDALQLFTDRVAEDRYVLAVVVVGSLDESTIWKRESLHVWVIEADNVSRRLTSDGKDERIFRILVENEIDIHAEIIPRTRFKHMVEGASRTAFSCNHFATRQMVYSADPSISAWFETANNVATKDKEKELLTFTTWTIHEHEHATRLLNAKRDIELAGQSIVHAAHSVAYTEIIRAGEICEDDVIYRAIDGNPELFQTIYLDVLAKRRNKKVLQGALDAIGRYLHQHHKQHLKPLLQYFKKHPSRVIPLSEVSDHFAYSQVYPWHLAAACRWLQENGYIEKLSAPFQLTKRSIETVEEPAFTEM